MKILRVTFVRQSDMETVHRVVREDSQKVLSELTLLMAEYDQYGVYGTWDQFTEEV